VAKQLIPDVKDPKPKLVKTITVISHNRPAYLRKVLQGLLTNNLTGWQIIIGQNPSTNITDCLAVIQQELGFQVPVTIRLHQKVLNGNDHPYEMVRYAFEEADSDLNIFIEDDTVPGNDLCELAHEYANLAAPGLALCYYYHGMPGVHEFSDTLVCQIPWYASNMAFCAVKSSWYQYLKPLWYYTDYPGYLPTHGYDHHLTAGSKLHNIHSWHVRQTRVEHIGLEGALHYGSINKHSHAKIKQVEKPLKYKFQW
jgi:hypothetical protein